MTFINSQPTFQTAAQINRSAFGCWPIGEGAGTVIHDISGAYPDSATTGSPAWNATPPELLLGGTQYAALGNVSFLQPFSFSVMVKVTSVPDYAPVLTTWNENAGGNHYLALMIFPGGGVFLYQGDPSNYDLITTTGTVVSNVWTSLIITIGAAATVYLDGVNIGSLTVTRHQPGTPAPLWTGFSPAFAGGVRHLLGSTAAIRGWSRVLIASEIAALAASPYIGTSAAPAYDPTNFFMS